MSSPDPAEDGFPNLRHLRLLVAAIDRGSLTAAAEDIHLSQPAASQAMARLARLYAAPMMERGPSGLSPTPEGSIVAARAARAFSHLDQATRALAPRSRLGRGLATDLLGRNVTVAQLRALAAFADSGSFSAAARALGLAEPSVHRAARDIERLIGAPLFEGTFRALHLTPAGETLATCAALVLRELADARTELRERAGLFDGQLVIGTLPLVRTRIVPQAVVALMARHPGARVEILDGTYDTLLRQLRAGACDVIVGALRDRAAPPGVTERFLFTDQHAIVARAGHPLSGRRLTLYDLADCTWVLPRRNSPSRAIFDMIAAEAGLDLSRGYVETGSLVALRGILTASDAVGLLSARQIEVEAKAGVLTTLDVPLPPESARAIGIATRADWQPTGLQAAFLDLLRAQV